MNLTQALVISSLALAACSSSQSEHLTPVKVEILQTEAGFRLMRDGDPFVIKGAGMESGYMDSFVAHGGNAIRTWTTNDDVQSARDVLDDALARGVAVVLCLPMQAERWGFDYDDEAAVAKQLAVFQKDVEVYRNHPALLAWIIGNELNLNYTNPAVYDAVNSISEMIHELDPNHPTTTAVAGINEKAIADIEERAPDLDFISLQVYGELFELPMRLKALGFEKPFFVTEWGAIGHWEVGNTSWGAPIEATSTEKAATYLRGYEEMLAPLNRQLIGSFVFYWGQKQERTPTWYGLFTEAGEETASIDVMHYLWNGEWPSNRSPEVRSVQLDDKTADDNIVLSVGEHYSAVVDIFDHDGDPVTFRWVLKPESDAEQVGGDHEERIANLNGFIDNEKAAEIQITAPESGPYRLFVYAYDGEGHAAHANIPFFVSPGDTQ
jgi:hypothetical protein